MSTNGENVSIVLCRPPHAVAPEWAWGRRLCEEFLSASSPSARIIVLDKNEHFSVKEVLARTTTEFVGIVLDDVVFWAPEGWQRLCAILQYASQIALVVPVSNESTVAEQRVAAPFVYHTPSLFRRACQLHRVRYSGRWQEVSTVDPFAFLCRRVDLERLPPSLPLTEVPTAVAAQGRSLAVAYDTYVHRYGRMYEQARSDLQVWIPLEAKDILDVGCAAGAFGAALLERQSCRVVGIELNTALVPHAARRLSHVIQQSVEDLPADRFTEAFDCIVCGDVLEHLRDPWTVVGKLTRWLKPAGRLIVTVPNVGHWSIVNDLLLGRWDLVPFSLLCWGHLRFFTRTGVEQLIRGHGLVPEYLQGTEDTLSTIGEEFLRRISTGIPEADMASLRTSEWLLVACKGVA